MTLEQPELGSDLPKGSGRERGATTKDGPKMITCQTGTPCRGMRTDVAACQCLVLQKFNGCHGM